MSDAMTSLIDGILYAVKTLINKAEYDQTVSGHVLYYVGNNKYVVRVNGEDYTVKSNGLFRAFDSVEITKPKNKWLNAYISYPSTVDITAEELCDEAELLRRESEEIRIANETERIANEKIRHEYYTEFVTKSEEYDAAEAARVDSCAIAIKNVNDAKSSIESSYASLQEDYSTLSQNTTVVISNCEQAVVRCNNAAQKCEDIAALGYVTNDVLKNYATKTDLANIDMSGLCKLVQENGKVYLEVI